MHRGMHRKCAMQVRIYNLWYTVTRLIETANKLMADGYNFEANLINNFAFNNESKIYKYIKSLSKSIYIYMFFLQTTKLSVTWPP